MLTCHYRNPSAESGFEDHPIIRENVHSFLSIRFDPAEIACQDTFGPGSCQNFIKVFAYIVFIPPLRDVWNYRHDLLILRK